MNATEENEQEEILHDLGMCDLVSHGEFSPEVNTWMDAVLSY